jgi:hypothetical protein
LSAQLLLPPLISPLPPHPPPSPSSPLPFLHCIIIVIIAIIIIIIILSMCCPRNTLLIHSVTDHSSMMCHHNIYAVHHGLFYWSLIYCESKSGVCHMFSEFCCLSTLCCI